MNEKNLPIKFFRKRENVDERRVEGGGSRTLPSFVLSESELKNQADKYSKALKDIFEEFNDRPTERKFIPATLNLEINDKAIAKSHRSEIKKIFNVNYKNNIIGYLGSNSLLIKVEDNKDFEKVESNIINIKKYRIGLSAIDDLERFDPIVELDGELQEELKVSLINYQDTSINEAVCNVFENYCDNNKIEVLKANYSPDLIIYRVNNASETTVDALLEFEAIESISFMPQYKIVCDLLTCDEEIEIKTPQTEVDYPVVGVLDSGIAKNKYLEPWLLDRKFSSYPDEYVDPLHGTFVSGVIIYGDELEKKTISGLEGCKLFDATVFPDPKKETVSEDQLIENVREAISSNSEIKIWNMSLGTKQEADSQNFSHFAQALDDIQVANDVIICKSAGNCSNFVSCAPKSRISKSADSVLSLVVGSIAHSKNSTDIAEKDHPSPFSRKGKGPANIIKPELVSYGGNVGLNGRSVIKNGVTSFDINGDLVTDVGTSFSTPRVSALLASLNQNISETYDPLLLKALAIHSAKYPENLNLSMTDRIVHMGFGLPAPVNEIIYNDEHEITLILQDTLNKGEFLEILEFPFPNSLIDQDGFYYGHVNLTLVTAPVLKSQGSEYCQSNLDVKFGTYDKIKTREIEQSSILNEFGPDGAENLLRKSNYKRSYERDLDAKYARERFLLNFGKKYHPIKKYSVDLEGFTPANKERKLKSPKNWYLRIEGLFRDFIQDFAEQNDEELSQDFCMILTVKDTKQTHNVYNEVSQLLTNGNFMHQDISIREDIRINNLK